MVEWYQDYRKTPFNKTFNEFNTYFPGNVNCEVTVNFLPYFYCFITLKMTRFGSIMDVKINVNLELAIVNFKEKIVHLRNFAWHKLII